MVNSSLYCNGVSRYSTRYLHSNLPHVLMGQVRNCYSKMTNIHKMDLRTHAKEVSARRVVAGNMNIILSFHVKLKTGFTTITELAISNNPFMLNPHAAGG